MIRSGRSPPSITATRAEAMAAPGRAPPRSPVAYTREAPNSPRVPATAEASPPITADTVLPRERAFVSSSSVPVVTAPSLAWANTQMFEIVMSFSVRSLCRSVVREFRSNDLESLEELNDLHVGFSVVLDDLAVFASRRLGHGGDLLSGRVPPSGSDAEVGRGHRVDRLRLGGHDPLKARVARFNDACSDADHRGQRAGDLVVAGFGLAVDLER